MPTRNVVLTGRQEALIEQLVRSGRYQNASEVLREGLRLIERREAEDAARLEALREAARIGVEALDHGDFTQFADVDELMRHIDTITETAIAVTADVRVDSANTGSE
jgi:antitoxin ParD1/3/4